VSQIELGGHGQGAETFLKATRQTWKAPIRAEYDRVADLGYRKIGVVTLSAGGTVLLDMLANGELAPPPDRVVMVGPLIAFRNRWVPWIWLLGPFRPASYAPLQQLADLVRRVQHDLATGIPADPDFKLLVVQSRGDPTCEPEGVQHLRNGFRGGTVQVEEIVSDRHMPVAMGDEEGAWTDAERAERRRILRIMAAFFTTH
jgi:hypothetical protein